MNLAQMKERLGVVLAKLEELNGVDSFTNEIVEEINTFSAEFEELKGKIEAKEKVEAQLASASNSTRKTAPKTVEATVVAAAKDNNGGFKDLGEFFVAVKDASNGKFDKRFQNTMYEKNGEDGGFLVPEELMSVVAKKLEDDESLYSKTRKITVSGNALSLPTDETSPWNGGVLSYWTAEGAQITQSKSKFGQAHWKLHKVAALITVTDELLEDTVALESYMKSSVPVSIMHTINSAIISGNGVGKPTGILNSGFKVAVAKEVSQLADTVVAENVIKMYSKMIPSARSGAAWYINPAVEAQLRLMKDPNGSFIYLAPGSQMNQTPYGTLLGLPVIPLIGSMPALGDEGDIILANLDYYYTITKQGGMKSSVSSHLYFDRDMQAYKFTMRIDGGCPFKAPVTTEFGAYTMSAIVTLAERA